MYTPIQRTSLIRRFTEKIMKSDDDIDNIIYNMSKNEEDKKKF